MEKTLRQIAERVQESCGGRNRNQSIGAGGHPVCGLFERHNLRHCGHVDTEVQVRARRIARSPYVAYYLPRSDGLTLGHTYLRKVPVHRGETVYMLYHYPFSRRIAASVGICVTRTYDRPRERRFDRRAERRAEVNAVVPLAVVSTAQCER